MHKFTHVDAFYQVARYVKKVNADPDCPKEYKIYGQVDFRGSVKLHGTNAGVTHDGERLIVQSRTQVITPQNDNAGFAAFVEQQGNAIIEIVESIRGKHGIDLGKNLTLYGEWIGPGIQKGMAINNLPERQWVLFSAKVSEGEKQDYLDIVPNLDNNFKSENIFSIFDGPTWDLSVDFSDPISKEKAIVLFEELVNGVERECPWGKRFGISGLGEGIVWQPIGKYWGNSDLFFKTKGEKHKVTKSRKKKESMDPEVLNSIEEFVDFAVTENRLNQGIGAIQEAGHSFEMKNIGHFLKWVGQDVQRECRLELEDNKLEWKQVSKAVNERARNFFKKKIEEEI